jgi:hypothetical protein
MKLKEKLAQDYWPNANKDDNETWDSVIQSAYLAGFEKALELAQDRVDSDSLATGEYEHNFAQLYNDIIRIGEEEVE